MAGHLISNYFKKLDSYEVMISIEEDFFKGVNYYRKKILKINPNIIINTMRIAVVESENYPKKALFINSYIPKLLERIFSDTKVKLIHLSTDCIFSGNKGGYKEQDIPDGKNLYSLTKFSGEIINEKDLTIRSSYIGPSLNGKKEELFDWFLTQNGNIDGYYNFIWNGITTLELAKKLNEIIKEDITGIYHLCSDNNISKFELLGKIKTVWGKHDILINKKYYPRLDRSLIDTRKKLSVDSYDKMFSELFEYMRSNKNLYSHYNY